MISVLCLSLKLFFNSLVCDRCIFGSSSKVLGNLRKSSELFGHFQKMFDNVRVIFGQVFENLRKSSESRRKSSENRQKRRHQDVYIIKRTLHVSSRIWILCSRGKNNISLVRYCSCHSKIKFISSRHRVISSMYVRAMIAASVDLDTQRIVYIVMYNCAGNSGIKATHLVFKSILMIIVTVITARD